MPTQAPSRGKVDSFSSFRDLAIFALFAIPVLGMVLRSMFGRFFGATLTSGLTGIGAWLLLGSLAIGIVAAVAAFLFTLMSGAGVGRSVRRGGWGGYIPSGGGGSWGGGGGGGGFSGGGGGFDGGGASGSW